MHEVGLPCMFCTGNRVSLDSCGVDTKDHTLSPSSTIEGRYIRSRTIVGLIGLW